MSRYILLARPIYMTMIFTKKKNLRKKTNLHVNRNSNFKSLPLFSFMQQQRQQEQNIINSNTNCQHGNVQFADIW